MEIYGTSPKQVVRLATELSGARTTENEVRGGVLKKPMDFLEQVRDLLDFVQDNDFRILGEDLLTQQVWTETQFRAQGGVEQVVEPCGRVCCVQERGLPRLPGSPEENSG